MSDFDKYDGDIPDGAPALRLTAIRVVAEVVALAEALQARVDELEAERGDAGVIADVLRLPGVKIWLLARFHPDKHPHANEAERELHAQNFQKIKAVYEIVERDQ
jgi:hypothetical protein